jgi:hypothetical protein
MPFMPDMGRFVGVVNRSGTLVRRGLERVKGWGQKLWALFPVRVREALPWLEEKLGFVLAGLVLVLVLVLLILLSVTIAAGRPAVLKEPEAGVPRSVSIPPENLFLPEEPDFLPPVILEREQRDAWTADDAEPYWYNPLEEGEEGWREQVEKVIDELLERVP